MTTNSTRLLATGCLYEKDKQRCVDDNDKDMGTSLIGWVMILMKNTKYTHDGG
jgi:hypothetical protein